MSHLGGKVAATLRNPEEADISVIVGYDELATRGLATRGLAMRGPFGWIFGTRSSKSAVVAAGVIAVLAMQGCGAGGPPSGSAPTVHSGDPSATGILASVPASAKSSGIPAASTSPASARSSSPVPSVTPPPATTKQALAGGSQSYSCVTSVQPHGTCGPYPGYTQVTGTSDAPYVDQNVWGGNSTYKQTLYANSPGNWYVIANAVNDSGSVLTYPNTGWHSTGKVDSYSTIVSSFSATLPHNAQAIGWAAYDLWFNNWKDEVMIQTDIDANSSYDCTAVATATFGGDPWHLCVFGSERVWKPGTNDQHLNNQASGTINVKAFLVWMENNGYLPAGSTWTGGSFGFEICNTNGTNQKFQVNAFSWKAN